MIVNRIAETKELSEKLSDDNNVIVVYAGEGVGKTSIITELLAQQSCSYIRVGILSSYKHTAYECDVFNCLIDELINAGLIKQNPIEKFRRLHSFSPALNIGIIGISANANELSVKKNIGNDIIKKLSRINHPIYIHIENSACIDNTSLEFLSLLSNKNENVKIILEVSTNDVAEISKLKELYKRCGMSPVFFCVEKMDWHHILEICSARRINLTGDSRDTYNMLNGNIRALIFQSRSEERLSFEAATDIDELFLINFLKLTDSILGISDIAQILQNYLKKDELNFTFSKANIVRIVDKLMKCNIVLDKRNMVLLSPNADEYYDCNYYRLSVEILADYYIPILLSEGVDTIPSAIIERLLLEMLKQRDNRASVLLDILSEYTYICGVNESYVDRVIETIIETNDYDKVLFHKAMELYIKLGSYNKVKRIILDEGLQEEVNFNLLYCTALVHTSENDLLTDSIISNAVAKCNSLRMKSSLLTCLISLRMRTNDSESVINQVNSYFEKKELLDTDRAVVMKNISIYLPYQQAMDYLSTSMRIFKSNKLENFCIATEITKCTKMAQNGALQESFELLKHLYSRDVLTPIDAIYIAHNMAILQIYMLSQEEILNEKHIASIEDALLNAYYYIGDRYTKAIVECNLLALYVFSSNYEKAHHFKDIINEPSYDSYGFEEFQHIRCSNLLYYYNTFDDMEERDKSISRLKVLKENSNTDLRNWIDYQLGSGDLRRGDKWYFLSQYCFRMGFVGHWIVSSADLK